MYNNINEWDRMVAGKLYNAGSKDIEKQHNRGMFLCDKFNRLPKWRQKKKQKTLEKLIPSSVGKNLCVFSPFYCEYGVNIKVGEGCFVNYSCTFLDISPIVLGNGVWIGANVTIATPNHPLLSNERLPQDYPDGNHDLEYSNPITIKDNVWVCSGAIICGGVTIGENSVIAAGAVVTRDVPANSLVAGMPARVIRQLDDKDRLHAWETYEKNELPLSDRKKNV